MTSTYSIAPLYQWSFDLTQVFTTPTPLEVDHWYAVDLDNDGTDEFIIPGEDFYGGSKRPGYVFDVNSNAQINYDGAIISYENFTATTQPREIIDVDFNGDGYKDIFIATHGWDIWPNPPGERNVLLLSDGNGGLAPKDVPHVDKEFSHSTAAVDIDGDGDLDIYVGNVKGAADVVPYMLLNDGFGNFSIDYSRLPDRVTDPAHEATYDSVQFADLDGNGHKDLILGKLNPEAYGAEHYSEIYWNDGSGYYSDTRKSNLPQPQNMGKNSTSYDIVALDVDSDGDLDLLNVHTQHNSGFVDGFPSISPGWELQLLINDGNGVFVDETSSRFLQGGLWEADPGYHMHFLRSVDLNNDGFEDLVPIFRGSGDKMNAPAFWLNDGTGRFGKILNNEIFSENLSYLAGRAYPVTTQDGVEFVLTAAVDGKIYSDPLNLTGPVSTGPGGANPATSGAAGFNELFYLNSNSDVQALVDNGTYASGLAHYLAVGIAEGRSGMASGANVSGTNADDNFTMAHGNSIVRLYAGNDSFVSGNGNDTVDGGTGTDTAVFSGARSDYVVFTSNGVTTVMDLAANRDGTDFLQNIENLTFSTETMTLAAAVVEPADADGSPFQIYRFYNTLTGSHFFTTSIEERNSVITNIPTMTYEGNSFDSNATEAGGGVAVHRFYNSDSGFHFYTASAAEAQSIQNSLPQFSYEGVAYYASETADAGGTALYRFFNTQSGSHFYTTSTEERDSIISTLGHYTYEGVAYYVDLA
ncbi:VCBS repeat-containing protein [Labrenzia sp. R4_2]|uniref:FG-GAP-like repeat-containing protein n=1 Tax=Labrenzia sp. R4_2 TaxID=2821107 RepID=UPI001ADCDF2A|nr:FG-GAP-like repeat-containing protein [Labrenzia sp. R4_2]MBO9422735.1 VCBS repeat-containing protein [Labrenzia sp. R4_2]